MLILFLLQQNGDADGHAPAQIGIGLIEGDDGLVDNISAADGFAAQGDGDDMAGKFLVVKGGQGDLSRVAGFDMGSAPFIQIGRFDLQGGEVGQDGDGRAGLSPIAQAQLPFDEGAGKGGAEGGGCQIFLGPFEQQGLDFDVQGQERIDAPFQFGQLETGALDIGLKGGGVTADGGLFAFAGIDVGLGDGEILFGFVPVVGVDIPHVFGDPFPGAILGPGVGGGGVGFGFAGAFQFDFGLGEAGVAGGGLADAGLGAAQRELRVADVLGVIEFGLVQFGFGGIQVGLGLTDGEFQLGGVELGDGIPGFDGGAFFDQPFDDRAAAVEGEGTPGGGDDFSPGADGQFSGGGALGGEGEGDVLHGGVAGG